MDTVEALFAASDPSLPELQTCLDGLGLPVASPQRDRALVHDIRALLHCASNIASLV
jgi:hypothetical protein